MTENTRSQRINDGSTQQSNYGAISSTSSSDFHSLSLREKFVRFVKSPLAVIALWSLFILWIYDISPRFSLSPVDEETYDQFRPFRATRQKSTPGLSVTFNVNYLPHLLPQTPATGRLMVCLATKDMNDKEPRYYITDDSSSQQVFGIDVYSAHPLQNMTMNESNALGYPKLRLQNIPTGEYWIQAVFRPYVLYNRSDSSKIWLPPFTTFEAEHGVLDAEGTLYSKPILASITGPPYAKLQEIQLNIDSIVPERPPLESKNKYLQHVKFRSPRLSDFWGIDVYLQAWVLLPGGYYEHPDVKYPLFIYHSHYSREFEFDMIETVEQLKLKLNEDNNPDLSYGYYFYKNWTSNGTEGLFSGRRGIIVQIQHANPYYDDSYAVNSENIGPYGDAITYEFLPYIEKKYRGIGKGWARTLYGGSTGGWESFAVQVLYPNEYNGCWSFCPDALDFHHVQLVNLYNDDNAYYSDDMWTQKEKPAKRNNLGEIQQTMVEENHHELAQGSFGRSGGQWDAWQAVYSPRADNGYPKMIWDKETGEIYGNVAKYWIDHFDMKVYLEKNWKFIGEKLVNKLHVYVGIFDSFYLNDAVYLMDRFLQTTKPYYNGTIEYGASSGVGFEHCWTGAYNQTLSLAWNTLNFRMIPKFVEHIVNSAPKDADLSFTKY